MLRGNWSVGARFLDLTTVDGMAVTVIVGETDAKKLSKVDSSDTLARCNRGEAGCDAVGFEGDWLRWRDGERDLIDLVNERIRLGDEVPSAKGVTSLLLSLSLCDISRALELSVTEARNST